MLKKISKILLIALFVLSVQAGTIPVHAKASNESLTKPEYTVKLVKVVIEEIEADNKSIPEKYTTASYSHEVYDRNNQLLAIFVTSLGGWYDSYSGWSQVTSISSSFTYTAISSLSLSTSKSGSYGYTNLLVSGSTFDTTTYHLSTSGNWSTY